MVTRTEGFDDSLIGANASAEEASEGTDTSSTSGIDIVLNHNLQETPPYDKKMYLAYIKDYVKAWVWVRPISRHVLYLVILDNQDKKKYTPVYWKYQHAGGEI